MPTSDAGKAIASRNATTHGLFARDVVLPALGEDPAAYRQLEDEWLAQFPPRTLLERHYVEKIAAASWRLRRLHRWQAQLFEDAALTEGERLDRLERAMRHETTLHRQIDTAVRMLNKDAEQLFARRVREQVQEDLRLSERECREEFQDGMALELEIQNRYCRFRKATEQAANELSVAPLDTRAEQVNEENCENELPPAEADAPMSGAAVGETKGETASDAADTQKCKNEPVPFHCDPRGVTDSLNPNHRYNLADNGRRRQNRPFGLLAPP